MNKEYIDSVLKDTDGRIVYCEQLLQLLSEAGYSLEESNIIRKVYAKRQTDKIKEFEKQLENSLGTDIAQYLISKIRFDCQLMYWKVHENAYKMCYGLSK